MPGNIHHIDIINNYFHTISDYCVKVLSASDINVKDNLMYGTNKGDDRFMHVQNSKDCEFSHNKYIATKGQIPSSILVIKGDLENITDNDNIAELLN